MNTFFRSAAIGLLAVLATISLSIAISLLAAQATVMRESNLKQWLVEGEVYQNNPLGVFIKPQIDLPPGIVSQFSLQASDLTSAIDAAFPPDYLQQHTETSVDAFYAWLRGETDTFQANVPVPDRLDNFVAALVPLLEPRVAALPVCTVQTASTTLCRPATASVTDLSERLARSAAVNSQLFSKPLTLSLDDATKPQPISLNQLDTAYQLVTPTIIVSFIIFLLSCVGTYALDTQPQRTTTLRLLARRLTFSFGFSTLSIYLLTYFIGNGTLNLPGTAASFAPFLRIALTDTLSTYGLFTLGTTLIVAAIWAGLHFLHKQRPVTPIA